MAGVLVMPAVFGVHVMTAVLSVFRVRRLGLIEHALVMLMTDGWLISLGV